VGALVVTRFDRKVVWRMRAGAVYQLVPEPPPPEMRHTCSRSFPPGLLLAALAHGPIHPTPHQLLRNINPH